MIRAATRILGFAGLLLTLTGCSATYVVTFHVTVPPGTNGSVRLEVIEHGPPTATNHTTVKAAPRVTGAVGICCTPEPIISIQAYVDVNGNGAHEANEPIARYPGGRFAITRDMSVNLTIPALAPPKTPTR